MVHKEGWISVVCVIATVTFVVVGTSAFAVQADGDVKTIVMEYIKENHPDAAVFIGEPDQMVWTEMSSELRPGHSSFVYTSDGWTIIIGHTITAETIYEVTVHNTNEGITWAGTVQEETVSETSYTHENEGCSANLNGDNVIDIIDIAIIATVFETRQGDTNWHSEADLNNDEVINIVDLTIAALHFGKKV